MAKQNKIKKRTSLSPNHSKHNSKFRLCLRVHLLRDGVSRNSGASSTKSHGSGPIRCHAWTCSLRFWFLQSLKLVAAQERIGISWKSAFIKIVVLFLFPEYLLPLPIALAASTSSQGIKHLQVCAFYLWVYNYHGEFINLQHCWRFLKYWNSGLRFFWEGHLNIQSGNGVFQS